MAPPSARETDATERIRRNALFGFASQAVTAAFTAALTLFLLRALSPREFGLFSLALAIGVVAGFPADFGIAQATARFVAERRHDRGAVAAVLGDALRLKLAASGAVAVALAVAAGPIASAYDLPGLVWPLRGIAVAMVAQGLFTLFTYAFGAQGRFPTSFAAIATESAAEFTATAGLVLAGGGAAAAAFGRSIGYAIGAGVALALALRLLGRRVLARGGDRASLRSLGSYGAVLLVVDGAYVLFEQLDVLLIGAIVGAAAAGMFQAPLRLVALLHYPALAVATAVAPRLARSDEHAPDVERFAAAARFVTIVQAALTAAVVAWATPIMELAAPEFEDSDDVLRALAPFVFLVGLGALFSLGANYLGEARRRIPVALAALGVNLAVDLALIPRIGIVGGAIGTDLGYAVYAPAHVWICARAIALPLRPLALTLARALLAGAVAAGVLALIGTDDLSLLEWVAGALAGPAAFVATLVVTRETTVGEIRSLLSRR